MKKAAGTILNVFAVLAVFAAIAAFVIYDTGLFDEFMKGRILKQLKTSYGQPFTCYSLSDRNPIFPKFDEEIKFSCYAEDGTYMDGTCDWKGTILAENYVHYYYAGSMDDEIAAIIDGCFDDYLVVEDFCAINEDRSLVNFPMAFGSATNGDEYIDNVSRYYTHFRVYVRAGVKNSEIQSALDKLSSSGYKGNVFFFEIKDIWFDALKDSGITCHPGYTHSTITLNRVSGNEQMEFEDMIRSPYSYTRGEYLPYSDTCWVVGYSKEPT